MYFPSCTSCRYVLYTYEQQRDWKLLMEPRITRYVRDWFNYSFSLKPLCSLCPEHPAWCSPLSLTSHHPLKSVSLSDMGVDKKPISSSAPLWESSDFLMLDEVKINHPPFPIWTYPVELQREPSMSEPLCERPAALCCWSFSAYLQG